MGYIRYKAVSSPAKIKSMRFLYRTIVGKVFDACVEHNYLALPRLFYNLQGLTPVKGIVKRTCQMAGFYCEWHTPRHAADTSLPKSEQRVILYSHGGGYVIGSTKSHRTIASALAKASGITVLTYDYSLAPERTFPYQVEEGFLLYQHLLSEGYRAENIIVAGDSAGASLSVDLVEMCLSNDVPKPRAMYLISPLLDYAGEQASLRSNNYIILSGKLERSFAKHVKIREYTAQDSYLKRDLSHYPPVLIQIGSYDILYDQAMEALANLKRANAEHTVEVWEDMFHVWHGFYGILPESEQAFNKAADFIQAQFE